MRTSLRNAILGLIDQVPIIGSGMARAIEDRYPSRREREQAAVIAEQQGTIEKLEADLDGLRRYTSDDERPRRDRRARNVGNRYLD